MTNSRSKENSQSLLNFIGIRSIKPLKVASLEGYSIRRVLLIGLIFPAFVTIPLLVTLGFALSPSFSRPVAISLIFASTIAGFAVGTLVLLKMTGFIVKFAKVKRRL